MFYLKKKYVVNLKNRAGKKMFYVDGFAGCDLS